MRQGELQSFSRKKTIDKYLEVSQIEEKTQIGSSLF